MLPHLQSVYSSAPGHLLGGITPPLTVYSTAPAEWATEHLLERITPLQSVYSTAESDWTTGHLLGETYFSAVGVIYSPSRLDHRTLVGRDIPLCSWCILQTQPIRPQDTCWGRLTPLQLVYPIAPADWATGHSLGEIYPSAVGVFYRPSRLDHRTLVGETYPSAVGVFYRPIRLGHRTLVGEY